VRTHTPLVAHICAIAMIGLVTAPADVVAMDMLAARLTGTRAAARRRDAAPHNAARATSPTAATRVPVLVWMRLTRCIHHLRRPTAAAHPQFAALQLPLQGRVGEGHKRMWGLLAAQRQHSDLRVPTTPPLGEAVRSAVELQADSSLSVLGFALAGAERL
jgi:hypothetical protein